jgi:hypothetical protein
LTGYDCQLSLTGAYGVTFTPSGAPSAGNYSYVQLINADITTANAISCTHSQGVDFPYPYGAIMGDDLAVDAPFIPLTPGYTATRTFNATMFLLWTSSTSSSIPVPIAYQTWGFQGSAQQDSSGTWWATTVGVPGPIGDVVPSTGSQTTDGYTVLQNGYPIWSGPAIETCD